MSEPFDADIWAVSFDGTPPFPKAEILCRDVLWQSQEHVRRWLAIHFRQPENSNPVAAVFVVSRDCSAKVLSYGEAISGVAPIVADELRHALQWMLNSRRRTATEVLAADNNARTVLAKNKPQN